MVFGQGFTGIVVSTIIALTSGIAFFICLREFAREVFGTSKPVEFAKSLRRNRNILFDEEQGRSFAIDDSVFEQLMSNRHAELRATGREWHDRSTYLMMIGFLGLVAMAGFLAGLSRFV